MPQTPNGAPIVLAHGIAPFDIVFKTLRKALRSASGAWDVLPLRCGSAPTNVRKRAAYSPTFSMSQQRAAQKRVVSLRVNATEAVTMDSKTTCFMPAMHRQHPPRQCATGHRAKRLIQWSNPLTAHLLLTRLASSPSSRGTGASSTSLRTRSSSSGADGRTRPGCAPGPRSRRSPSHRSSGR